MVKARGTMDAPETISLGKIRRQVQVIWIISIWAGNTAEHRCNYGTVHTRTNGIWLSWICTLGSCGEGKAVRANTACQCTWGLDTIPTSVLFCQNNDSVYELICLAMLCGVWLRNVPFSDTFSVMNCINRLTTETVNKYNGFALFCF